MILIADDSEYERSLMGEVVRDLLKAPCEIVEDGEEAIKKMNEGAQKYKAIITDFNMPGKNGAQVILEAIRHDVKKILLRSSHSRGVLLKKMEEYDIPVERIQLMTKGNYDFNGLISYLEEFLEE